jgi:hypothetical protein
MSDIKTIAEAIAVRRVQYPLSPAADATYLEQDDLASLLLRPKCQHGDLHLLLRRRAPYLSSPVFGSSEVRNIEEGGV